MIQMLNTDMYNNLVNLAVSTKIAIPTSVKLADEPVIIDHFPSSTAVISGYNPRRYFFSPG